VIPVIWAEIAISTRNQIHIANVRTRRKVFIVRFPSRVLSFNAKTMANVWQTVNAVVPMDGLGFSAKLQQTNYLCQVSMARAT
jgi:hypothetical protein